MKKILAVLSVALLVGCSPSTDTINDDYVIPEGLKDCQFYRMYNKNQNSIVVVRCQGSTTSTTVTKNKSKATTVVK